MKFNLALPLLPRLGMIGLLSCAYYIGAQLSRQLASTPQDVTPVWPPDGLASAAVLIFGYWILPGVLIGSFWANIGAFLDGSGWINLISSVLAVLAIAGGTTLGTFLGVFCLRKTIRKRYPLERMGDVGKFLVLTGMLGPVVNATTGVTALCVVEKVPWQAYTNVWLMWWISNVAGIFIVTPMLLSWANYFSCNLTSQHQILPKNLTDYQRITEAIVLSGLVIFLSQSTFGAGYPLEYMLIPLLIWAAFRFGQLGATLFILLISTFAVVSTVRGFGVFVRPQLNESLILLQSFIAVMVFTTLILGAALAERQRSEDKLRITLKELAKINAGLENRVQQRTEELNDKNTRLKRALKELKKAQAQLIQTEKMSSLGQLVAGIAHEINNPVNFIHGNIAHIHNYGEDLLHLINLYQQYHPDCHEEIEDFTAEIDLDFLQSDLVEMLSSMKMGTERIKSIVLSLRNFSRLDESDFKEADLHEGLDSTLLMLNHRLKPDVEVCKDYGDLPLVACYPAQLNQLFLNIFTNALDAILSEEIQPKQIVIKTSKIDDNLVQISIKDNGLGIPRNIKAQIFDPFFTTKPIGQGTGLGLSISYQIVVNQHRGKLICNSAPGQGTEFIIEIPIRGIKL